MENLLLDYAITKDSYGNNVLKIFLDEIEDDGREYNITFLSIPLKELASAIKAELDENPTSQT